MSWLVLSPFGPLIWAIAFVADHAWTIHCARLYRSQSKVRFEGSFELEPMWQDEVNALRRVSPRFLFVLVLWTAVLFVIRAAWPPAPYALVLGAVLLTQLAVHVRHVRNWYYYRWTIPAARGRIEYPRPVVLGASACEMGSTLHSCKIRR